MSSAASPIRSTSTSRRDQPYEPPAPDSPRRAASTNSRTASSNSTPRRSNTTAAAHPPTASRHANLAHVQQRDYETTSLQKPQPTRRSASAERQSDKRLSQEVGGSSHQRTSSRTRHQAGEQVQPTPIIPAMSKTTSSGSQRGSSSAAAQTSQAPRRRTTIECQTGTWSLGKTVGAGSMGKVKLAKNLDTGEQAAIKIVPRYSQDEHRSQADRERADHSKEVRTAREAAIVTLANHPYICGMRDVVRTHYHWYMLFEYVNGGQMLDYIISHGKLKEKQARKFGRQIASALDYCHRNSIVHRDLKIENILISKTGDIKIIDFGLSNLFSPRAHLKTFCGSLYFAAPELLQAKQYTGPEVDIWSFGIVLYVLVCGKVPFDDQSMPQLHAKIKKGVVEYPPWLSAECKHIISRMLVTIPAQRATLTEIMSHPWMTKTYGSPPDNHLPHREPLSLPLDPKVIEKMTGFDFGPADYITRELERIISSEEYQKAVKNAAKKPHSHADSERKRSVFDFYQRRKSASSRDALTAPSTDTVALGEDPLNAFSPLISIYYLVREKQEKEKEEVNPGALALPQSPGQTPLKMPDLPLPEAAITNFATPEMSGENTGGRARPRARTNGEDEIAPVAQSVRNQEQAAQSPQMRTSAIKKESAAAGLLRRFSTRKRRDSLTEQAKPVAPTFNISKPDESAASNRQSFNMRKTREAPPSAYEKVANNHPDLLAPPASADGGERRFKGLGRSTSVNSGDMRRRWSRRGVSEGNALRSSGANSESERSSLAEPRSRAGEVQSDTDHEKSPSGRLSARTRSVGHSRRESMQPRRLRKSRREDDVPEETDADLAEHTDQGRSTDNMETIKPVYLKGLFSVSTTSSKPLSLIRSDIIRVLQQLGVDFKEIKGGFMCRHVPSIDLNKVVDPAPAEPRTSMHRRKISFAGLRSPGDNREYEDFVEQQKSSPAPRQSSQQRRRAADASFTNSEAESEEDQEERAQAPRSTGRAAGETTTHVQSDLGNSMILKFEILVVKIPLLSLHGLQFKKVDGGTWQYKKMAETILSELRL